jgi:crotonobetaine/carnitine-CoA ligase
MNAKTDPSERTLPALLLRNAEENAEAPFIFDDQGTLTRGGAVELARGMVNAMSELGLERGDTAAIMLDNRREFISSWFGVSCLGAIQVPVNPTTVGERLVHILNQSRCKLIVAAPESVAQVDAVADRLQYLERVVVVGEGESSRFPTTQWAELAYDPSRGELASLDYSDIGAVMFTSGSTGPAKGATLSHGLQWTNGAQPTGLFDMGPQDVVYTCLPLHHNMAQGYGVMVAAVSGGAVRIAQRFKADEFWEDVKRHNATVLSFVGAMLVLLEKRPETPQDVDNPLRVGFGVPIPPALHERFEKRFGMELVHAYGSTEVTIVTWNVGPDRVIGSAGKPLPDYEVRIADKFDRPVAPGELGQILVRSSEPYSVYSGYFNDPERTVQAWQNLWYHTGDRGRLDEKGNVWFNDRVADVVRRMGEFISSHEVEQVLLSNPEIEMAAAYGVPSELIEEELMVAIIRKPGSTITAEEVRAWCAERLERFAVPRFVDFLGELPMTPSGKVEKYKLKKAGVTPTADDARATKQEKN